jgi:hypothetical protein
MHCAIHPDVFEKVGLTKAASIRSRMTETELNMKNIDHYDRDSMEKGHKSSKY